jgi:hypothetical protein
MIKLLACIALLAAVPETPKEVEDFRERRDGCDDFLGEEPYDEERRAFLTEKINELCRGADNEFAELRVRYAGNKAVLELLEDYEDRIDSDTE